LIFRSRLGVAALRRCRIADHARFISGGIALAGGNRSDFLLLGLDLSVALNLGIALDRPRCVPRHIALPLGNRGGIFLLGLDAGIPLNLHAVRRTLNSAAGRLLRNLRKSNRVEQR